MKLITKAELKNTLKDLSVEELTEEICRLSDLYIQVNEYFYAKYGGEEAKNVLFERAKNVIEGEFFPSRGKPHARIYVAKKAISDFRKQCTDKKKVAELQLFYVHTLSRFSCSINIDDSVYDAIYISLCEFAIDAGSINSNEALTDFLPVLKDVERIGIDIGFGDKGFVSDMLKDRGIIITDLLPAAESSERSDKTTYLKRRQNFKF